jgi:hypothetical protein
VIAADLSEEEIAQVYQAFGVSRGSVIELRVTNQEERQSLEGYVAPSLIGSRAISSVYVELLPSGSGMDVSTYNITWCTPAMYMSALATAGITAAKIVVAAPYGVSGTAALTGVYKAYEDMTGKKLDDKKYVHHTGYPGGLRETTLGEMRATKPEEIILHAVRGMMPKGRLGRQMFKKLKVYAGPEHPHTAQKPEVWTW